MRRPGLVLAIAIAASCLAGAVDALAHSGGPLDADGCHSDRRLGNYHCHTGEAAGYTFASHDEMESAVRTGEFPATKDDGGGFLRRLWPFGKKPAPEATTPDAAVASPVASPPAPVATATPPPQPSPSPRSVPASASAPVDQSSARPDEAPKAAVPGTEPAAPAAPGPAPAASRPGSVATPSGEVDGDYERRLRTLEDLRLKGLVTEDEYRAKRRAILDEL